MRRITDVRRGPQTGSEESHQERRRHAFARHIGDHDSDLIVVDSYPVIVIAGYFLSRKIVGADIKAVELWIASRQQFELHLTRDFQLGLKPLFLDELLV